MTGCVVLVMSRCHNKECHICIKNVITERMTLNDCHSPSSAPVCLVVCTTFPRILLSLLPNSLPHQPPVPRLFITFTCLHLIMFDSPVYLVPSVSFSLCRSLCMLQCVASDFLPVPVNCLKLK